MVGENKAKIDASAAAVSERQRSKIGFPYMDLKSATEMAEAIHNHVGQGDCDDDQLAAWTNQSAKSSTFRVQMYAARTFGVLEAEGGRHKLTTLGRSIVDPKQAREAKARAFLTVPLYKAVFDKYRGGVLPPPAALERDIVGLGVSEKQKDRARQVFERSADQAGFFEHGKNRLVMPGVVAQKLEGDKADQQKKGAGGNGGGDQPPVDPVIKGLVDRLPKPDSNWPIAARVKWLQTMANAFGLIYESDNDAGDIVVGVRKATVD